MPRETTTAQESRTEVAGFKVTPSEKAALHRLRDHLVTTESELLRHHTMAELVEMAAALPKKRRVAGGPRG